MWKMFTLVIISKLLHFCVGNLNDNSKWNAFPISGSHDSFTQSMASTNEFGPDCPTSIKDMCKLFGSTAKNIVYKWSVTQSLTFRKQLQAGIRYFDLRVAPGKDPDSTEQVYFTHGLLCNKVEPTLQEVSSFLNENPREVVLLDFNHFYKMSDSSHLKLYNLILDTFGEKICPFIKDLEGRRQLNLNSMMEHGQQVIVFYQCEFAKNRPELWSGSSIRAPWANTCDTQKLLSFLEESYGYRRQSPLADLFYVCQGVLTPDFRYMMGHLMGNLRDDIATKVSVKTVNI